MRKHTSQIAITAMRLAAEADKSGYSHCEMIEGSLMVANPGQFPEIIYERWRADRNGVPPQQLSARKVELIGGMERSTCIGQLFQVVEETAAPAFGMFSGMIIYANYGNMPNLIERRYKEDMTARGQRLAARDKLVETNEVRQTTEARTAIFEIRLPESNDGMGAPRATITVSAPENLTSEDVRESLLGLGLEIMGSDSGIFVRKLKREKHWSLEDFIAAAKKGDNLY